MRTATVSLLAGAAVLATSVPGHAAGGWFASGAAGDVNGDGKADVVAMSTTTLKIEYGDGAGQPDIVTAGPGSLSYLRNTTP